MKTQSSPRVLTRRSHGDRLRTGGLLLITALALVACNPYIDLNKGIAHAGFMSKNQAFAGKMKLANGATASWSSLGSDSTEVPIAITNTVATGLTLKLAGKISDNQTGTNNIEATSKGAATLKGTKDPNTIPLDPNTIPVNPNIP